MNRLLYWLSRHPGWVIVAFLIALLVADSVPTAVQWALFALAFGYVPGRDMEDKPADRRNVHREM